jgi:hypothetical protein
MSHFDRSIVSAVSRRVLTLSTLAASLAVSGCGGGVDSSRASTSIVSWEVFREKAKQVVDGRTIFIVEWDLAVTEEELRSRYDRYVRQMQGIDEVSEPLAVNLWFGIDDVWMPNEQRNLTYCVTNDFGSYKTRAINEMFSATSDWQRRVNVNFTHVSAHDGNCSNANPNVTFAVRPWNGNGACAFFPHGGACVERTLVINFPLYDSIPKPTLGVFRHELGHILGMRHEQTRPESGTCFEDNNWRGLTPYDQGSVMHYPQCNGIAGSPWNITARDALGAGRVYGPHHPAAMGQTTAVVRPDGYGSVQYVTGGRIKELAWPPWNVGGNPIYGSPSDTAGAPNSDSQPALFQRDLRVPAVAFRNGDHIWYLVLNGTWLPDDLTQRTSAPAATGNPGAYQRSDLYNSIVYRGTDNHIYELYTDQTNWDVGDLTWLASAPDAASDPTPYVRHDRVNAVLYRSTNNHVIQLELIGGTTWVTHDLTTSFTIPPMTATGRPMGYINASIFGATSVVYRGTDQHIWAITFEGGWSYKDLTAATGAGSAAGDPYPIVRADGGDSVYWRGWDGRIYEINRPFGSSTWTNWTLTTTPLTSDDPTAYVRNDGSTAVLFRNPADNHVHEFAFWNGSWTPRDLTMLSGHAP